MHYAVERYGKPGDECVWAVREAGRVVFYGTEGQCRDWAWLMNFARQGREHEDRLEELAGELRNSLPSSESEPESER